jgi:hypothetical protein
MESSSGVRVGMIIGVAVGTVVGAIVGLIDAAIVGEIGAVDGAIVGAIGPIDGAIVGIIVGAAVITKVGDGEAVMSFGLTTLSDFLHPPSINNNTIIDIAIINLFFFIILFPFRYSFWGVIITVYKYNRNFFVGYDSETLYFPKSYLPILNIIIPYQIK